MKSSIRLFAAIVCSSSEVRNAFRGRGLMAAWWRGILALHNKPIAPQLKSSQEYTIIADGFRFYASLYQCLGILFLTLAMLNVPMGFVSGYWTLLGILTSIYLWLAGDLARSGAQDFEIDARSGYISLVCFFFMITMFLASFVVAASVVFQYQQLLSPPLNLLLTSLLFTFGIGSYALELVYLVVRRT
jgi:hypothetical protein